MSKGLPKDKNVIKPKPQRRTKGTEAGGSAAVDSGFQDTTSDNKCLLVVKANLRLNNPEKLRRDTPVTLVKDPIDPGKISVIQNATNFGEYDGPSKQTLLECMKLGYTYRGDLINITQTGVTVEIRGEGA